MNSLQHSRLPYTALRTFECFARLGDIGLAAAELGVTASAISHQLRALETFLGVALTTRRGRRLQLSGEGRRYFEALRPGFQVLDDATGQLRRGPRARRILVSALPLIAGQWLIPALGRFRAAYPAIQVQVQYARHRTYASDEADVSLRFGQGPWPGYRHRRVLSGAVHPIGSPALAGTLRHAFTPADALRLPLVHDGSADAWRAWLAAGEGAVPGVLPGVVCEDAALARSAALSGMGIALLPSVLVARDIEAGDLVLLSERSLHAGDDYHLCIRDDCATVTEVRQVSDWLLKESAAG